MDNITVQTHTDMLVQRTAPVQERTMTMEQKQIKNKITARYNWSALGIGFQIIGAIITIVAAMGIIGCCLFLKGGDYGDKLFAGIYKETMNIFIEYNLVITGIAMIIINTLSAVIILKHSKTAKLRDFIKKPQMKTLDIVLACIAILGISSTDSFIMSFLSKIFGSSSKAIGSLLGGGITSDNLFISILSIAYIAIIGPISEEILCRGAILPTSSHISPKFGLFVSAFLFGLMHGNITQLFNAFLLGLLLGYVTLKSRSIIPAMLMHIANNSLATIEAFIPSKATNIIELTACIVGLICLVVLIWRNGRIDEKVEKLPIENPVTSEELEVLEPVKKGELTIKSFFKSWAFWCVFGYEALNCLLIMFMGNMMG